MPVTDLMPELHLSTEMPRMSAKLPVYDGDQLTCWVTDERALELIKSGEVDIIRTKKKIRELRVRHSGRAFTVTPSTGGGGVGRTGGPQMGQPHRRDNYYNVKGFWHIDRLPRSFRPVFMAVLDSVSRKAA